MDRPSPLPISFEDGWIDDKPFPHMVLPQALGSRVAERLRRELDGHQSWTRREQAGFYRTFQADLSVLDGDAQLAYLASSPVLASLRDQVASSFGTALDERVDFSVLRWQEGCGIGPHSDYPTGQRHRLLVSISTPVWEASQGGILSLLDDENPAERSEHKRHFLPRSGSADCFEISERSFHCVTEVKRGMRYTLRYTFYPSGKPSG